MQRYLTYAFLILNSIVCFGQSGAEEAGVGKKMFYSAMVSGGRGIFVASSSAPSKFPTLEMRIGGSAAYRLSDLFFLEARLFFGVRKKRVAMNVQGQPYRIGPPFLDLDATASSRDHYFYEIPMSLRFEFPYPRIGLKAGMNYRSFLPHNASVDFLTARKELGVIGGAFVRLRQHVNLGFDQYFGITKVYSTAGFVDGHAVDVDVRNQSTIVYLEYKF